MKAQTNVVFACAASLGLSLIWGSTICGQRSSQSIPEFNVQQVNRHSEKRPRIEVCFVLDTTGSMSGLIQSAKDKIWSIANEMMLTDPKPEIRFGLIGYRDRGDDYITNVFDLTDDIDSIHTQLTGFEAQGGNDHPESVNQALHESVSKMNWSSSREVLKIVFLVGDAPPHMDYANDILYPEVCTQALEKDLIINTVLCGGDSQTQEIWMEIARKSEGKFVAIPQDGGTIAIATPFDEEISKFNTAVNKTVCGYGNASEQQAIQSKLASNQSASAESVADRADYFSKGRGEAGAGTGGGAKVIGGENDLVELLIDGAVEMSAIENDKLPEDLQKLSPDKQKTELEKRIAARKEAQAKIDELVKQRSEYIEKERTRLAAEGKTDSFDSNVKEMIRTQAAAKGINYPNK